VILPADHPEALPPSDGQLIHWNKIIGVHA
jgi:hypothetical protein